MSTLVHPGRRDAVRRRPVPTFAWRTLLCAMSAGAACAAAPAAPPLSLDAALGIAEARSQAVPAERAAALAARERAVAAGQRPDPVLRIGLDNVPVEGAAEHWLTREAMSARSIGLTQALPDAAKRDARAQRYRQEAAWALARADVRRAELRRDTTLAWWAVRAEAARLALLAHQRQQAALIQEAAEAAYRAGRDAQADVFAARAGPARLDDQRLHAEARLAAARATLRRWVGDAADLPLAEAPPMAIDAPAAVHDPELRAAAAGEAVARARADVAREERRPDWSVDLRFAQRGPRYDDMVSLGVSVPLRWDPANRQDRELAARLAEAAQAEADVQELRRVRQAETERWRERWRAGLRRLAGYDDTLLPLAVARTESATGAYRAGHGSLQAVLEARQAETALRLERVQIEFDTASDWTRLTTLQLPPEASR